MITAGPALTQEECYAWIAFGEMADMPPRPGPGGRYKTRHEVMESQNTADHETHLRRLGAFRELPRFREGAARRLDAGSGVRRCATMPAVSGSLEEKAAEQAAEKTAAEQAAEQAAKARPPPLRAASRFRS